MVWYFLFIPTPPPPHFFKIHSCSVLYQAHVGGTVFYASNCKKPVRRFRPLHILPIALRGCVEKSSNKSSLVFVSTFVDAVGQY